MIYPVLTYSRDLGDFTHDLVALVHHGLKAIRLIYKGKSEADFIARIAEIQELINEQDIQLDIIIDLPGSKPIVGELSNGCDVTAGASYTLTDKPSAETIATEGLFNHNSFSTLVPGDIISVADDQLNLQIKSIGISGIICEALNSFHLTSGRSISIKNKPFAFEANSEKDLALAKALQYKNVKLLVSFARSVDDLLQVKVLQPDMDVIPKIESILDDATILQMLEHCDTVMLGRGDLSTSVKPNELFTFQQRLIDLCTENNKQLIVATGLLEGIADNGYPSIAEMMDYGYLRDRGIKAFLIAGSNARKKPFETLAFMRSFEHQQ